MGSGTVTYSELAFVQITFPFLVPEPLYQPSDGTYWCNPIRELLELGENNEVVTTVAETRTSGYYSGDVLRLSEVGRCSMQKFGPKEPSDSLGLPDPLH